VRTGSARECAGTGSKEKRMVQVAVIGSGLAGLAAALFLARRGHAVEVIERDEDDLATRPEGAWFRRGVGQAGQTHAFLARSSRVMAEEAPDVLAALEAAGAYRRHADTLATDSDPAPAQSVFERRLAYEAVLRGIVRAEPLARITLGLEATGLIAEADSGTPIVTGVRTARGDLRAGLVVDASGRRSHAAQWLAAIGARPLVEELHPCGFFYLTRWYRLRPGGAFPPGPLPVPGRTHFGLYLACPVGEGQFSISLGLSEREPHRHALRDGAVFDRLVASVPRLAPWLAQGEGIADPQPFAGIANGRRRLVDAQGPLVHGFALLGDAAMHTNPTLGRGASLAFSHAQQLARTVDRAGRAPGEFIANFEAWTDEHLGEWFDSQVAVDDEMTQRFHALAQGEPLPPLSMATRRRVAMQSLAPDDPLIATALGRMMNLLTRPSELEADAEVSRRVAAFIDAHPGLDEHREGLTRAEFAAAVLSAARPPAPAAPR
jgi:2-polyprenyl-6-methoxyphenol hydroxylase-like FAD-dependent oxidoreductase